MNTCISTVVLEDMLESLEYAAPSGKHSSLMTQLILASLSGQTSPQTRPWSTNLLSSWLLRCSAVLSGLSLWILSQFLANPEFTCRRCWSTHQSTVPTSAGLHNEVTPPLFLMRWEVCVCLASNNGHLPLRHCHAWLRSSWTKMTSVHTIFVNALIPDQGIPGHTPVTTTHSMFGGGGWSVKLRGGGPTQTRKERAENAKDFLPVRRLCQIPHRRLTERHD